VYQFGFRKGYSTEQAMLEITDNLRNYLDNNQIVCGLFLDLSKAFDTVNHEILLAKMDKYGIRGEPLTLFKNYLSNRKQYVKIGCTESELLEMTCGVPQGSTLGPLLFVLYINDMPNCAKKLSFRTFADDTNVFYS
jgi:retron-type reverse transcriptase